MTNDRLKNISPNSLEMDDRYIHIFIYENYGFMFDNSNQPINYNNHFWVVNNLNLMNYVKFTKKMARSFYY